MIVDIIIAYLLQMAFTVGIVFLFGWLIALCNRKFYANFGKYGRAVCYATGFIGTPIHELSHALFSVIFGHKINEIKLFQISDDGVLGYVNHSYNPKNIYHRIGNFFIGIAPIVVISGILYLVAYLLMPSFTTQAEILTEGISSISIESILSSIVNVVSEFFTFATSWQWWVFIVVGILLSLHMTLSGADIKGAKDGLIILLAILLVADIIIGLVSEETLTLVTRFIIGIGSMLFCILLISLIISAIAVAISYVFRLIFRKRI